LRRRTTLTPVSAKAPATSAKPPSAGVGPAEHFDDAEASASPEHVFPEQLPLALALYVTCAATHASAAFTSSTKSCTTPLQTTIPFVEQFDWQLPLKSALHCAVPFAWH
jgi:hypothetical protein